MPRSCARAFLALVATSMIVAGPACVLEPAAPVEFLRPGAPPCAFSCTVSLETTSMGDASGPEVVATLVNASDRELTVSVHRESSIEFSTWFEEGVLLPGQERTVIMRFSPDTPGAFSGRATFVEDPDVGPDLVVAVSVVVEP